MAVCQENIDFSTCFQTGVAFCPEAVRASYSFLAIASWSVKIGRLLEIAKKNICGPMASDGSSRAICWKLIPNPSNFRLVTTGSSGVKGTELVFLLAASSSSITRFNFSTSSVSASILADSFT